MRILLTGAAGFLGWHTRLRLHALSNHTIVPVIRDNWGRLDELCRDADAVIHIAGTNRGEPTSVEHSNVQLAEELAVALGREARPVRVVYANSIQDGNGTAYGTGKGRAGERLLAAALTNGGSMVDVRLPNLFGEHGRPAYNSFVATFVDRIAEGGTPEIHDNEVALLHVQDAAQALIDGLSTDQQRLDPDGRLTGVREVWDLLVEFASGYDTGEFPDLSTPFRVDLFNTYRAALFPSRYPIALTPHNDARGSFVETVRCLGGEGQTSFSTTVPGVTRGEHYHLRKIERFAVIQGQATMSLRKMFTDEVFDFPVTGDAPAAVDMPVGWVHNITNTGNDLLLTQFWSHELYRPEAPDTYPQPVRQVQEEDAG